MNLGWKVNGDDPGILGLEIYIWFWKYSFHKFLLPKVWTVESRPFTLSLDRILLRACNTLMQNTIQFFQCYIYWAIHISIFKLFLLFLVCIQNKRLLWRALLQHEFFKYFSQIPRATECLDLDKIEMHLWHVRTWQAAAEELIVATINIFKKFIFK